MLKESFKIYCAINDGIINLVDKVHFLIQVLQYLPIISETMSFWTSGFLGIYMFLLPVFRNAKA